MPITTDDRLRALARTALGDPWAVAAITILDLGGLVEHLTAAIALDIPADRATIHWGTARRVVASRGTLDVALVELAAGLATTHTVNRHALKAIEATATSTQWDAIVDTVAEASAVAIATDT